MRYYGKLCGLGGKSLEGRVAELLSLVRLGGEAGRRPLRTYSKGMLQRIGLAAGAVTVLAFALPGIRGLALTLLLLSGIGLIGAFALIGAAAPWLAPPEKPCPSPVWYLLPDVALMAWPSPPCN